MWGETRAVCEGKAVTDQTTKATCDCERSHNGLGLAGRECDCQEDGVQQTTDLTGCGGFTEAERRGVKRLADRIRFELHCCRGEDSPYLERKRIALAVLEEALA